MAALPPSRRASTDFGRPVFTAAAFYLCAKRHKVLAESVAMIFFNRYFASCMLIFSPIFLAA